MKSMTKPAIALLVILSATLALGRSLTTEVKHLLSAAVVERTNR